MSQEYLIDIYTIDENTIDLAVQIAQEHVVVCDTLKEKDYTTIIVWADNQDDVIDADEYIKNTLKIKTKIKDFYYNEAGVKIRRQDGWRKSSKKDVK